MSAPSARTLSAVASMFAILAAPTAPGADLTDAERLHRTRCLGCHGPDIYLRAERKIQSRDSLERQVQRCEVALELKWFDEDIHAVATWLDRQYYHFKP